MPCTLPLTPFKGSKMTQVLCSGSDNVQSGAVAELWPAVSHLRSVRRDGSKGIYECAAVYSRYKPLSFSLWPRTPRSLFIPCLPVTVPLVMLPSQLRTLLINNIIMLLPSSVLPDSQVLAPARCDVAVPDWTRVPTARSNLGGELFIIGFCRPASLFCDLLIELTHSVADYIRAAEQERSRL